MTVGWAETRMGEGIMRKEWGCIFGSSARAGRGILLSGLWFLLGVGIAGDARASSDEQATNALPDYWSESRMLVGVPGASPSLAAGFFNPAAWPMRPEGGLLFGWDEPIEEAGAAIDRSDWLGVVSLRGLSFGVRSYQYADAFENDWHWEEYTVGLGGGTDGFATGLSYAWSDGPSCATTRSARWNAGMIARWRPVSVGLAGAWERGDANADGLRDYFVQADVGLRPLGPRVTFFADAVWERDQDFEEIRTGYGLELHPLRGLSVAAKARNDGQVSIGLRIGLSPGSHPGLAGHLDADQEHRATTYLVESGAPWPDLGLFEPGPSHPEIELKGPMVYRRYKFFDDRRTLFGLLRRIDRYATDPDVAGVVINLSGARIGGEMLWELREQLAGLQAAGKRVVVYGDEITQGQYMLASVADEIWVDPEGIVIVPGLAGGRTYLRGTLEKLGVGFDEWRFFTYKSAYETFSREQLSEADREQIGTLIDDIYGSMAEMVVAGRGISREDWDRAVDEKAMLLPREAQAASLIDSIGTFEDAKESARRIEAQRAAASGPAWLGGLLGDPVWGPMEWGEPPRIALLYAIGPTQMDSGIKARVLAKKIKEAREDSGVRAVVLRADSPGGSGLASDLVGREMRETAKVKPMIVSQGAVAGSGGYWISMYADTIVSSPMSVTGSIGVIGGWFYNDGLGEKLGVTWDGVWRGAHADVGQGMRLPLIGVTVPERNLTPEERERMEFLIRDSYEQFVEKVADGRGLPVEEVDRIGQGRIWSGTRARELDLVDEIGGLWCSLQLAKRAAGLAPERRIAITQGPGIGSFNLGFLRPRLFGLFGGRPETFEEGTNDPWAAGGYPLTRHDPESLLSPGERTYLETLLRARGRPVHMMEPIRISLEDE
ncbi:MAG: hypothetical protein GF330_10270 [Candidatus Eisenbacteria bacterium]|nr:hypothetical protein [Candidatus Eisenbacteria bacterium]